MKTTTKPKSLIPWLKRMGFDRSFRKDGSNKVRCSQCEAMCVNGHPIHERGCPNEKGD